MKKIIQLTCLLVTLVSSYICAPTDLGDGSHYLMKYGYLSYDYSVRRSSYINEKLISEAIAKYQRFYGLNITGVLNNETRTMMEKPRCGVKDINNENRRYKLYETKWDKKSLTYGVSKYTKKLKNNSVDDVFKRAFKMWSDVTDLKFTRTKKGYSDIDIKFAKGFHGDYFPFDGPGRILAHASMPDGEKKCTVHFDDDEPFTDGVKKGINLVHVAAHEFGHSLGLEHSDVKSSLMFPSYSDYEHEPRLHSDDIKGIQALYGIKTKSKT